MSLEPAATSRLDDRVAIYDVLVRYARAIDSSDFDGVAACFSDDVMYEYSDASPEIGQQALVERIKARLASFSRTTHYVMNVTMDFEGDISQVETYSIACMVQQAKPDRPERILLRGLRYLDTFARRDGHWVISKRKIVGEWMTATPSLPL